MLTLILVLIIIYIALGIIGFVVKGLFFLFIIAAALFVITVLSSFFQAGSRRGRTKSEKKQTKVNKEGDM